jgi:predicted phosphodiesterase
MLRILSDLHVYDARSQVRDLGQLEPLLAGVRTLVINGDSCEMRPGVPTPDITRLQGFFRARVPEVIFVTGNHDPDISGTHELLLAGGRVWVTHGDVCFDDLTPWSRKQPDLVRAVRQLLAADPAADYRELGVRLRVAREAARLVGAELDPADRRVSAQFVRLWDTFFPPRQIIAMLRAWRDLPALSAGLAAAQRPSAQVVVTGHVHFPRVWIRSPGPAVINTGSFFSPLGGHLVDVAGDRVFVRRIRRSRGQFEAGRLVAEIPLTAVIV